MYFYLSDTHKPLVPIPTNGDVMAFSTTAQYLGRVRFRGFSIKYVIEGNENYLINGEKHSLQKNHYLLANHHSEGFVEIDSKKPVEGICIDIDIQTLSTIAHEECGHYSDRIIRSLENVMHSKDYQANTTKADETHVGRYMQQCASTLLASPKEDRVIEKEFYFEIGQRVIQDHLGHEWPKQISKKNEILLPQIEMKKMISAKLYMDENFTKTFSIKEIASLAGMSEFKFFRNFKYVFGESPYKYLLKKRLWFSCFLLHNKKANVTEAAFESGFSDIHTFSRAYKSFFTVAPTHNRQYFR
jgi:AraC-like DNA-binding protein